MHYCATFAKGDFAYFCSTQKENLTFEIIFCLAVQSGDSSYHDKVLLANWIYCFVWNLKGEAAAQMLLSLSYKEQNSRLTVTILKCKNLPAMDLNGYSGENTKRNKYKRDALAK